LIFTKSIKELSTQGSGRKRKEIKRIQLVRRIANIMMVKTTIQKYLDLGGPLAKTHINRTAIPNTLIDLGETINIMSKQIMDKLKLPNLQYTPTLLQLADKFVIKPNGVLEDIYYSQILGNILLIS